MRFISRPEGEVPGLTCVPLLREEFLLITPRSHPLAARAAPPGAPLTVLDTECLWDLTFCSHLPLLHPAGGHRPPV
ncbi:MAG: hypothetical protein ACLRWQ_04460 [Flavonifractor plautii]